MNRVVVIEVHIPIYKLNLYIKIWKNFDMHSTHYISCCCRNRILHLLLCTVLRVQWCIYEYIYIYSPLACIIYTGRQRRDNGGEGSCSVLTFVRSVPSTVLWAKRVRALVPSIDRYLTPRTTDTRGTYRPPPSLTRVEQIRSNQLENHTTSVKLIAIFSL